MKRFYKIRIYVLGLAACMAALASCDIDDDAQVCDYNLQLNYHYNREDTSDGNLLKQYVSSITEYLFDENGILFGVNELHWDECGELVSEKTIPPGRYSVIAWGNMTGIDIVELPQISNVNDRTLMTLHPDNPTLAEVGAPQANGDRLFYGYRTFVVNEQGISRVRVDMTHSHLALGFQVKVNDHTFAEDTRFVMELKEVPSLYRFMPEYCAGYRVTPFTHDPLLDPYLKISNDVDHYIPFVEQTANIYTHVTGGTMDSEGMIEGLFLTYRLRNTTSPVLNFYVYPDSDSTTPLHLIEDYPLDDFFAAHYPGLDLDKTLRQEYMLMIEIDGNLITVLPGDAGELGGNDMGGNNNGDAGELDGNDMGGNNNGDAGELDGNDIGSNEGGNPGGLDPGEELEKMPEPR